MSPAASSSVCFFPFLGVPGYWLSVFFIESVGRKDVQMMGFIAMGKKLFLPLFFFALILALSFASRVYAVLKFIFLHLIEALHNVVDLRA
jgi:hypothetical protein